METSVETRLSTVSLDWIERKGQADKVAGAQLYHCEQLGVREAVRRGTKSHDQKYLSAEAPNLWEESWTMSWAGGRLGEKQEEEKVSLPHGGVLTSVASLVP